MLNLARYEIVRALGTGAAGGVYLAEDRLAGGRQVALKRLHARADELLRASLEREFTVLAQLALPGIARVLDFGIAPADGDDPGGPFFTRTYVEGLPLDEAAARFGTDGRIALVARVADVVAPLHRRGIVHGDLKPANVIVDASGAPHVIDFGLARRTKEHRGEGGSGTPAFMAPEIIAGEPPTVRSDVYALGATLWTLLVGAPPHAELGPRALGSRARGALPAVPPGVAKDVRAALDVALRALAPDPADRLPTVTELRDALGAAGGPRALSPFIAPRPRGHEEALALLEAAHGSVVVRGPRRSGRTTLLHEARWRDELRGGVVATMTVPELAGLAPLARLLADLLVLAPPSEAGRSVAQRAIAGLDGADAAARLADALSTVVESMPRAVILVDDLDRADRAVGDALRAATGAGARVVATCVDDLAPAVRALGGTSIALGPIDVASVAALVAETLGPVEPGVAPAIHVRTGGRAGAVVDTLAALGSAPTAHDVRALAPDAEALALARSRIAAAPTSLRSVLTVAALARGSLARSTLLALALEMPGEGSGKRTTVADGSRKGREQGRETKSSVDALIVTALEQGFLTTNDARVALGDSSLAAALRETVDAAQSRALAVALLAVAPADEPAARAWLALAAGDRASRATAVPSAVRARETAGSARAAAELAEEALAIFTGRSAEEAHLLAGRARYASGDYDAAATHAAAVAGDEAAPLSSRREASLDAGRALTSAGRYDEAVRALEAGREGSDDVARVRVLRELAKVHLRRGDYATVERIGNEGLAAAAPDDLARVELLTACGMAASYRGEHAVAVTRYGEALALARDHGARREEANVLTFLAIDHYRRGELRAARDLYEQTLAIARELGDVGAMASYALNLGAVTFSLGEPAAAAEHYETAARLARRGARAPTEVMARANLASLHAWLGLYARARGEAEAVLADAERLGMRAAAAQATGILGDVAARSGETNDALAHFDDATARYRALGQQREVVEALLDAAEALLDRGGPADASAAAGRLGQARSIARDAGVTDFATRLRLLLARTRGATGDVDGALGELDAVAHACTDLGSREPRWQARAAAGKFRAERGLTALARRDDHEALDTLRELAAALPDDQREAFWQDPRRRAVRARAAPDPDRPEHLVPELPPTTTNVAPEDPRKTRLLEITKRLAAEHDLDRLLERITDAAIELSGAERGFVLLTGDDGQLAPHTTRDTTDDPHAAFSRSIAEAVLIDGEPIVTVDARDDRRLAEYMSVHKLALRSVCALPIRSRARTVGVLYLEHRSRRGRFAETDLDVLAALADQAAIALENARLLRENEAKRRELEQANGELATAKSEIERLLVARTEELEEARRELGRARDDMARTWGRHGIVGRSEAMKRVFALIDRVRETSVPVVIGGESGTGKELVARAIHFGGPRAKKAFVALHCGAIPETLIETELFGHVKGAFTGADRERKGAFVMASEGTLFLDEAADMPPKMQVDLLRVLQDGRVRPVGGEDDVRVDVRVIAATNRSLRRLVEAKRFREDLFYRLDVVEIVLPPLRERRDDIPVLCEHFLASFAKRYGTRPKRLAREALTRLVAHPFPGNVRQLEHLLLNAWVLAEGDTIGASDISSGDAVPTTETAPPSTPPPAAHVGGEPVAVELPASVDEHKSKEKQRILAALEACNWNRVRAAQKLAMPRRTFYRRLGEYGIL